MADIIDSSSSSEAVRNGGDNLWHGGARRERVRDMCRVIRGSGLGFGVCTALALSNLDADGQGNDGVASLCGGHGWRTSVGWAGASWGGWSWIVDMAAIQASAGNG